MFTVWMWKNTVFPLVYSVEDKLIHAVSLDIIEKKIALSRILNRVSDYISNNENYYNKHVNGLIKK